LLPRPWWLRLLSAKMPVHPLPRAVNAPANAMTGVAVMAVVAVAVAAPKDVLKAVPTDARIPVVNARKVARKDAMTAANAPTFDLTVVRKAAAKTAPWLDLAVKAANHRAVTVVAKPVPTTATRPAVRCV
jgi:hypothetical protein